MKLLILYLLRQTANICYPLFVCILAVINSQDVDNSVFLINNVEEPELTDAVSPCIGIISLKLLDVISPERLFLNLWIHKRVEFFSQETGIWG